MKKQTSLSILILLTVSLACKAVPGFATPIPSPSSTPRITPKPSATWTPAATSTHTPTVTPTEGPIGEFQFGEVVALDFLRVDWRQETNALVHQSLPGCTVIASGGADFPGAALPVTEIAGYTWLTANGAYLLKIGDQISGAIHVDYGEKSTACRKAAETLLKSLHAVRTYAEAGACINAAKQRLNVGKTAAVRASSYLRTAPRWAEETRVRLVAPTEKLTLTITGGPLCAIYNKGEYSYWQVNLSSGETGWMAEGDLNEYYLAPKKYDGLNTITRSLPQGTRSLGQASLIFPGTRM